MTYTATNTTTGGLTRPLRRAEAWLDDRGRAGWIVAMILGFIFFWPVGLALLAYITWTNRWSKSMFKFNGCATRTSHSFKSANSGNSAFDAYRSETIRRLEEEQVAFEAFLKRLRDARDKQEFDAFMEDRARANSDAKADAEPKDDATRKDIAAY
ncbi:DUF2852 domain-containing protein [Szabonella alba]|uniref:DUF2852 domain-containing protein n=1 Tax=Szabonella alba TaxID=2804194 RepID=A0A8K0VBG0_9RHOB|nr:DUF2852 domain-containing protein [Szabonella alba]MBL4917901.1 DUF2852 domain-containing protein [Szabonella alba]